MKNNFLLLLMMLLPMMVWANAVEIDGIHYNLNTEAKTAGVTFPFSYYTSSVVIPEKVIHEGTEYSVTSIGDYAFSGCSSLTSITIPNSVTSIGEGAFLQCTGLLDIFCYAKKVPQAWSLVFYSSNITNATLHVPAGSVSVYQATKPWNQFKAIVPLSVQEVGFVNIDGIYYDLNTETKTAGVTFLYNSYYTSSVVIPEKVIHEGTEYNVTSIGDYAFRDCRGLTSVTIPNSVTSIGDYAFHDCSGLTSVTIPNSVTSIGECAFQGCFALISITIPNSVTSIGKGAFNKCDGLTSITIPSSVTSIGDYVFLYCSDLASIIIPSSVTSIGNYAFSGCSSLTSITIPNSVTNIGDQAFSICRGLTSITISNSVTRIGSNAFLLCTGLTSITIPNSVTSIEQSAFFACTGLTSITIPSSVTNIGEGAFCDCRGLLDMFCYAENVPQTGDYLFDRSNIANATLHVPAGSVSAYQATEPWNQFKAIVPLGDQEVGVDGINVENKKETVRYTIGGIRTSSPQKGLNIVRMSDGTTKKVLK